MNQTSLLQGLQSLGLPARAEAVQNLFAVMDEAGQGVAAGKQFKIMLDKHKRTDGYRARQKDDQHMRLVRRAVDAMLGAVPGM